MQERVTTKSNVTDAALNHPPYPLTSLTSSGTNEIPNFMINIEPSTSSTSKPSRKVVHSESLSRNLDAQNPILIDDLSFCQEEIKPSPSPLIPKIVESSAIVVNQDKNIKSPIKEKDIEIPQKSDKSKVVTKGGGIVENQDDDDGDWTDSAVMPTSSQLFNSDSPHASSSLRSKDKHLSASVSTSTANHEDGRTSSLTNPAESAVSSIPEPSSSRKRGCDINNSKSKEINNDESFKSNDNSPSAKQQKVRGNVDVHDNIRSFPKGVVCNQSISSIDGNNRIGSTSAANSSSSSNRSSDDTNKENLIEEEQDGWLIALRGSERDEILAQKTELKYQMIEKLEENGGKSLGGLPPEAETIEKELAIKLPILQSKSIPTNNNNTVVASSSSELLPSNSVRRGWFGVRNDVRRFRKNAVRVSSHTISSKEMDAVLPKESERERQVLTSLYTVFLYI